MKEERKKYLVFKLSDEMKSCTKIDAELFKKMDVKRGLRNEDGTGETTIYVDATKIDTSSIEKYSNVEFVGLLPQEELPGRLKDFDVCLNLFRNDDLSQDVSPLKFYEYLATGKPVVSTPVPLQVLDYKDCIYIADGATDFVSKCKEALAESPDSEKRQKRLDEAKKCSWDERVKTMRSILTW